VSISLAGLLRALCQSIVLVCEVIVSISLAGAVRGCVD
jgi:hypothetical protein